MTQANGTRCPCPIHPAFHEEIWISQVRAIQEQVVLAVLPATLYGILTVLIVSSIYALTRQYGRLQPPIIITLLALFVSTTVYLIITLLAVQSAILDSMIVSPSSLRGLPSEVIPAPPLDSDAPRDYYRAQSCTSTATLTVNILLGDAIVCWRACVLWQGNRAVKTTCAVFLLTTFALGMVDTVFRCMPSARGTPDRHAIGSVYAGLTYGVAAFVLSFSTNLLATLLVGYRAWKARHEFRKYIVVGPRRSQMEKVLALLIESGAVYCTFWAVSAVWQIGLYESSIVLNTRSDSFWNIFGIIINGALVPLVAIYPTIIIVLVALNKSQMENGLLPTVSVPSLPRVAGVS